MRTFIKFVCGSIPFYFQIVKPCPQTPRPNPTPVQPSSKPKLGLHKYPQVAPSTPKCKEGVPSQGGSTGKNTGLQHVREKYYHREGFKKKSREFPITGGGRSPPFPTYFIYNFVNP